MENHGKGNLMENQDPEATGKSVGTPDACLIRGNCQWKQKVLWLFKSTRLGLSPSAERSKCLTSITHPFSLDLRGCYGVTKQALMQEGVSSYLNIRQHCVHFYKTDLITLAFPRWIPPTPMASFGTGLVGLSGVTDGKLSRVGHKSFWG